MNSPQNGVRWRFTFAHEVAAALFAGGLFVAEGGHRIHAGGPASGKVGGD